jgi:hypothetical protein
MKLGLLFTALLAAPAAASRGAMSLPRNALPATAARFRTSAAAADHSRAASSGLALKLRGGGVAAAAASTASSEGGVLGAIVSQVASEIANCNTSPAKKYGFIGACCNWFLGFSAVYDSLRNGPQVISLPMTFSMLMYSVLFGRWAAFDVSPKNYVLAGSHLFNIAAQ